MATSMAANSSVCTLTAFSRNDANGFHADALGGFAAFSAAACRRGCVADALQHLVPFGELTKRRVLAVQKFRVGQANEKLAAGRIRMLGAGHGEDTAHVRTVIKLGFDFVKIGRASCRERG